jgi:hypothetical protein
MYFNRVTIVEKQTNRKWKELFDTQTFFLKRISISKSSKFYCIGSCFAENVRNVLETTYQKKCLPSFETLLVNKACEIADTIALGKYHMNYYSSASILQEFERSYYQNGDFPPVAVENFRIKDGKKFQTIGATAYQDPYRREVYANSVNEINNLSIRISNCVKAGLVEANCFIITLGLVELFRVKTSKLVFNQYPSYQGIGYSADGLEFFRQTVSDVESDLRSIIKLIKSIKESNKIIFSVSPVPLAATFTDSDVFSANVYSKSTLRSAVEHVLDPKSGIYYFPSYEMALNFGSDFFESRDLRHANRNHVEFIMKIFFNSLDD